ncbi:MAG: DUF3187 family protein [candidate division Zixibacteria bacterium]|nr:DUF3187 family protein [candidate division Zixibacteria bacterium]
MKARPRLTGNRVTATVQYAIVVLCLVTNQIPSNLQAADNPFGFIETRSQSPVQQLRCGPIHHVPWVIPADTYTLSIRHNWKNMWLYRHDICRIDAEVHEVITRLRIGLGRGLEIEGELPVRYVSGGIMDGLIEGFHDSFNIDNAGRDDFPRDDFAFNIRNGSGDDGWSHSGAEQTGWNLGNATLALSFDVGTIASIKPRLIMTLGLKFPTGTRTEFFGNQSMDITLSMSGGINVGSLHWYASSAVSYYGDKKMIGIKLRQWRISNLVGLEYKGEKSNHAWTAQILHENGVAHNYDVFSDATYEVMFGYQCRLFPRVLMEFSILENVFIFDNSPDFGFHTALTHSL